MADEPTKKKSTAKKARGNPPPKASTGETAAGAPDAAAAAAEPMRQKLLAAREAFDQGREQILQAREMLQETIRNPDAPYPRGLFNQMLWRCERALGMQSAFFSQAGQDRFLDTRVFNGKRNGVFVEIGGYNGVNGSNCLFFESFGDWSGLLVEPAPMYFARASAFRRATCLDCAIAPEAGKQEFLEVREGYTQMSGLTAFYDEDTRKTIESEPRHKGELIEVQTRTLEDVLSEHQLTEIDYISLDVEGGEKAVLQGFPFEKFSVQAWTVENNRADPEIVTLMRDRGYDFVEVLGVDEVYVRRAEKAG